MKTKVKLFMSSIMMLLFVGVFSGCTSDDEFILTSDLGELSAEDNENVKTINDFLSKTFPYGEPRVDFHEEKGKLRNNYVGFESYNYKNPPCIVINSRKELESVYKGEMEIPEMDFSKISIIMGIVQLSYPFVYVYDGINIKNSNDETVVTLNFAVREGATLAYCALSSYYFYKIVPKFKPGKTIRAESKCQPLPW